MTVLALVALSLLGSFIGLLAAALTRTLATPKAPPPRPLAPGSTEAYTDLPDKLGALIRRRTVSSFEASGFDEAEFRGFLDDLPRLFPAFHAVATKEEFGPYGVLYEWKGGDPSLEPAMLTSHFDVVPAPDPETWAHPPFAGTIAEGCVWGRGTQDVKVTLASALAAADRLAAGGFRPRRSLLFAFGGDEEVGGSMGAGSIGRTLAARGIKAAFLLDEGGPIGEGLVPSADRPLGLVGLAEKGYADVVLTATGKGGHASMPPSRTATGDLARAVARLEARPSKARLCASARAFIEGLSPYVPFARRFLFRNLWLTWPLVRAAFRASPSTAALVRTTRAPTKLEGSPRENVLAERATAIVNLRVLPGESCAEALGRLAACVEGSGVLASFAHPDLVNEPMPESPAGGPGWEAIAAGMALGYPEVAPIPFLFSAATDSKHYKDVARAIYRLTPLPQDAADLARVHGRDERVRLEALARCALFYEGLIASC